LEPGLFVLVPPELGRATEFAGNPYVVARQLATGADYFILFIVGPIGGRSLADNVTSRGLDDSFLPFRRRKTPPKHAPAFPPR